MRLYQNAKQYCKIFLHYYDIRRFVSHARLQRLNGFHPVTPPSHIIHDLLPSPTGHIPPSPSHTLATRKRESAAHAPQSFRKHTTIELSVTGIRLPAYPYRISFLSTCAVSLGSLLFSQRPVSSGILNLAEQARHFSFVHTTARPPLEQTRRLTRLEEWRCAVTLRRLE